jgi:lysophospholipase L1-like esterase
MSKRFPDGPVVLLGASYAAGWKLTLPGIHVVNRGVPGQQSFELLARFDSDVVAAKPRAVVIWGFINDVFRSPREQLDESLARSRASIEAMVRKARAAGIEPVLATELTTGPRESTWSEWATSWAGWLLGRESYQDFINTHVLKVNDWIREYSSKEGLLLLDLHSALSDGRGRRRNGFATPDGSHVSEKGYEALSNYAAPILDRHLRTAN